MALVLLHSVHNPKENCPSKTRCLTHYPSYSFARAMYLLQRKHVRSCGIAYKVLYVRNSFIFLGIGSASTW